MTALSIQSPYPIFTDIDGTPLDNGYIWLGVANLAPQTNPIVAYWDAALTIPAVQPIRTISGYPVNAGTTGRLYVNSDYSILVQNKNGSQVYSAPAATDRFSATVVSLDIITITPSGRVGINNTSPSVTLQVTNSGSEIFRLSNTTSLERLHFYTQNTPGTSRVESQNSDLQLFAYDGNNLTLGTSNAERMRINSAGNVTIGNTSTIGGKLSVWDGLFTGANDASAQIHSYRASTDAGGSFFYFNKARGTIAAPTLVSSGDDIGSIVFRGYDGTAYQDAVKIFAEVDGTPGTNDMPGRLVFSTTPDGTATLQERLRIDSDGNVFVTGTGKLGYGTGSGGTVTQTTSRTTAVTINKTNGQITLVSAAGTTVWQTFLVNNSTVNAADTVIVSQDSGTDNYQIFVVRVATGVFRIMFATTGGTTVEQPVFNFAVISAKTS